MLDNAYSCSAAELRLQPVPQVEMAHPRRNAAAVTPREPKFTKRGRRPVRIVGQHACKITRRYLFSAAEKSVTVQKMAKQNDKQTV